MRVQSLIREMGSCVPHGEAKNIYVYKMEYYLAIKKNENLPFATKWMNFEDIKQNITVDYS